MSDQKSNENRNPNLPDEGHSGAQLLATNNDESEDDSDLFVVEDSPPREGVAQLGAPNWGTIRRVDCSFDMNSLASPPLKIFSRRDMRGCGFDREQVPAWSAGSPPLKSDGNPPLVSNRTPAGGPAKGYKYGSALFYEKGPAGDLFQQNTAWQSTQPKEREWQWDLAVEWEIEHRDPLWKAEEFAHGVRPQFTRPTGNDIFHYSKDGLLPWQFCRYTTLSRRTQWMADLLDNCAEHVKDLGIQKKPKDLTNPDVTPYPELDSHEYERLFYSTDDIKWARFWNRFKLMDEQSELIEADVLKLHNKLAIIPSRPVVDEQFHVEHSYWRNDQFHREECKFCAADRYLLRLETILRRLHYYIYMWNDYAACADVRRRMRGRRYY